MVIRRWGSEDKMEDIVRIDNSPYAVYRKCYYEVEKYKVKLRDRSMKMCYNKPIFGVSDSLSGR